MLCNRYFLKKVIGSGAAASVYFAWDQFLEQDVAIKVLSLDGLSSQKEAKQLKISLRTEAIAVMKLSNPYILKVFNYERHSPWEFLVMEYIDGKNLREITKSSRDRHIPLKDLIQIAIHCLEGLGHAHDLNIIHNDLKPSNIMIDRDGKLKICDFGLAMMARKHDVWQGTVIAGTPAYMSPERIKREQGTARSDLYSLGAMLYAIGNGRTPFGSNSKKAIVNHLRAPLPPSQRLPPIVHQILQKAMEKKPELRFQNAKEMSDAFKDALSFIDVKLPLPSSEPAPSSSNEIFTTDPSMSANWMVTSSQALHLEELAVSLRGKPVSSEIIEVEPLPEKRKPSGPPPLPASVLEPIRKAPEGMVLIHSDGITDLDGEEHVVKKFYIQKHLVTNQEYLDFLKTRRDLTPPAYWNGLKPPRDKLDHPVVEVNLEEALIYAESLGLRLPTSVEWRSASLGPNGANFPWGAEWNGSYANTKELKLGTTTKIGTYPKFHKGCFDLIGNVWEWCLDDFGAEQAWVFGGSYREKCYKDGNIVRNKVNRKKRYAFLGFRCAMDFE